MKPIYNLIESTAWLHVHVGANVHHVHYARTYGVGVGMDSSSSTRPSNDRENDFAALVDNGRCRCQSGILSLTKKNGSPPWPSWPLQIEMYDLVSNVICQEQKMPCTLSWIARNVPKWVQGITRIQITAY